MSEKTPLSSNILLPYNYSGEQDYVKQLQESEKRFQIIFDQAPIGLIYVDVNGKWLLVNQKICDILGYSSNELTQRNFRDLTHPDDLALNQKYFQRLLNNEITTFVIEKRFIRKDNLITWANVTVSRVDDDQGHPQYLIGFVEDINVRKRTEEEYKRLLEREKVARREAESATEKLTVLQTITDTALAHLELENVLGELIQRIGDVLRTNTAAKLVPTEKLKMHASKGLEPATAQKIEIPAGQEEQGREIVLREANLRMEEFLGMASHELRTPLTTIKANTQLAIRRLKEVLRLVELIPEDIVQKLEATVGMLMRAERQVSVLNRLVSDLIDISRIQTGRLQLHLRREPYNLITLVSEVVQEQRKAMPERIISMSLPENEAVFVLADPDRIAQVITNYLSNALKYSEGCEPVNVMLTLQHFRDESGVERGWAKVSVQDNGPGLSQEEQKHVWERFYQSQHVQVASGSGMGLGLGLHICQTLIERHHGQVGVESVSGKGSTFWFTLPLVKDTFSMNAVPSN